MHYILQIEQKTKFWGLIQQKIINLNKYLL